MLFYIRILIFGYIPHQKLADGKANKKIVYKNTASFNKTFLKIYHTKDCATKTPSLYIYG